MPQRAAWELCSPTWWEPESTGHGILLRVASTEGVSHLWGTVRSKREFIQGLHLLSRRMMLRERLSKPQTPETVRVF